MPASKGKTVVCKICQVCHRRKSLTYFPYQRREKGTYSDNICKKCRALYKHEYYEKNKHKRKEMRREHPEIFRMAEKNRFAKLKAEILVAYGNRCFCCGETEPRFLTVEHSWHDGGEHRKRVGKQVYRDLRKKGFPKNIGIIILCWNCNMATRYGEICPHKKVGGYERIG